MKWRVGDLLVPNPSRLHRQFEGERKLCPVVALQLLKEFHLAGPSVVAFVSTGTQPHLCTRRAVAAFGPGAAV